MSMRVGVMVTAVSRPKVPVPRCPKGRTRLPKQKDRLAGDSSYARSWLFPERLVPNDFGKVGQVTQPENGASILTEEIRRRSLSAGMSTDFAGDATDSNRRSAP